MFKQKGLALVSMCLSLIQENISLYSSYFIKVEEEDTELDVVIPCDRIPNWIQISDSSDTDSEESSTDERSDTDGSQSGIVEEVAVGLIPRVYDLRSINNISVSDVEEYSEEDNSSNHNKDESSQERSDQEDSDSINSSGSDLESDVDDEDRSEENHDEKDDDMK